MHSKLLISLFTLAMSFTAQASLEEQLEKISDDWRIKGEAVLRIRQQGSNSVKVYYCDEQDFLNSRQFNYEWLKVYTCRSDLDAFFAPQIDYCAESLQVSAQYSTEMLRVVDPYSSGRCSDAGQIQEARKI